MANKNVNTEAKVVDLSEVRRDQIKAQIKAKGDVGEIWTIKQKFYQKRKVSLLS